MHLCLGDAPPAAGNLNSVEFSVHETITYEKNTVVVRARAANGNARTFGGSTNHIPGDVGDRSTVFGGYAREKNI